MIGMREEERLAALVHKIGAHALVMDLGDVHDVVSHAWVLSWVGNVSAWWVLVNSGKLRRLTPDEGQKAVASCLIWALVALTQRVVHIGAWHRASYRGDSTPTPERTAR